MDKHPIGSETIQRCPHDQENPYTMVLNALIRDNNISPNCRMIIIFLLSNKNNWSIRVSQLVREFKKFLGKDTIYKLINEAIEAGYLMRQEYTENNLKRYKYLLSEKPKFKKFLRYPDFQETGRQDTENPDSKERISSKKEYLEEEQQQEGEPAAAVVGSLEKKKDKKTYECLKDLAVPQKEKLWLTEHYSEEEVIKAIEFATHPNTNISKSLTAAIKWACKEKPEIPITPEQIIEKNKIHAAEIKKSVPIQKGAYLEILSKHIEIGFEGPWQPTCISYDDKDFLQKLNASLLKFAKKLKCFSDPKTKEVKNE
jgi:hypothetical protein